MTDEFLVDLAEIARRSPDPGQVGGKAASLGRLIAAGLSVPAGVVLLGDRAPVPADLAGLRAPLVVRSSAALEDGAGGSAAGVFESIRDVTHAEVAAAWAAVRASAETPAARAYAAVRGVATVAMAVIVQEQIAGKRGVLYTRTPGTPRAAAMVIEHDERDVAVERDGDHLDDATEQLDLPVAAIASLRAAGLAAEAAIGAAEGADVEWVWTGDALWIVQARPIVHPRTVAAAPPAAMLAGAPAGDWSWDVTHNPRPLSPAQASLVARVDAVGMAIIGGYLYTRAAPAATAAATRPLGAAEVLHAWQRELVPALDWALAPVRNVATPPLEAALRAFDEVHAIYVGPLATLLRDARASLTEVPGDAGPAGVSAWIARAARGEITRAQALDAVGDVSLEWDVAAPTFREHPGYLDAAIAAWRAPARARPARTLSAALHQVREEDDLFYFAAQAAVRRALLGVARARRLADPDDVFFVGVDDAMSLALDLLVARADRARADRARAAAWSMPLAIRAGRAVFEPPRTAAVWRGAGSGGRVIGVAEVLVPGADRAMAGSVVVARSISPATIVVLGQAAAIVTEHGGLLGHAASIARELDIPCVVGCQGATAVLRTGDRVLVDGTAGLVAKLSET